MRHRSAFRGVQLDLVAGRPFHSRSGGRCSDRVRVIPGQGFKFMPLIGEVLADLVEGRAAPGRRAFLG